MSIIACCGLDCSLCPAHLAWKNDDEALRRQTAEEWSRIYQADITPEQISCQGCHASEAPLFGHCRVCAVRSCVQSKGWATCAPCPKFPCADLDFILKHSSQARKTLEGLRANEC
ncbi:MAG: DUF3795 domain-containing protein [Desulfarculaceae bacterium]|nr:DUF3795 domain-containing protein [Desulfarculaceae bacterium]